MELAWGASAGQRDVWPSPAQEQLLRATLIGDERAVAAWTAIRSQLDIDDLDGATQALLPALRKNLLELGVQDELLDLFKGVHRYSWARNQLLLAPMIPKVAALEQAGIPTLLLKGAAFVADTRLDAGMRPMNDIDVLVPTARTREAIDVLLDEGLDPVGEVPPWYVADYAPRFVPSHGFRDEVDRQLDLHWHVLHASCQPDADDDFWEAAADIELLGVATRALCPADELLLVILHGLRWNAIPTYRWVLDAALLCAGAIGPVDYDRLVAQARRRRVTVAVHAGLYYLRRAMAAPIPHEAVASLKPRWPAALLQRAELRALTTQPQSRSARQWAVLYHQQRARREIALETARTLGAHVGVERRRLGLRRMGDLPRLRSGAPTGPGHPDSEVAAAVGAGRQATSRRAVTLGRPIALGDGDTARDYTAHGTWRAEPTGCWIAGREARLVLPLAQPARSLLAVEVSADAFLSHGHPRQRLEVRANGGRVGEMSIDREGGLRRELAVLPEELVGGRSEVDLVLRAPDAVSPAALGIDEDDRAVGVFLRELIVREPRVCEIGDTLMLGEGSGDDDMLAQGWGAAEPLGRWTVGELAQLLLCVDGAVAPFELEVDAIPFVGVAGRKLRVEVLINGRRAASLAYDDLAAQASAVRLAVSRKALGARGGMLLAWRIVDPRSPRALGVSDDGRRLGLFVRRVSLVARGADV
jgi:hypothetical protein